MIDVAGHVLGISKITFSTIRHIACAPKRCTLQGEEIWDIIEPVLRLLTLSSPPLTRLLTHTHTLSVSLVDEGDLKVVLVTGTGDPYAPQGSESGQWVGSTSIACRCFLRGKADSFPSLHFSIIQGCPVAALLSNIIHSKLTAVLPRQHPFPFFRTVPQGMIYSRRHGFPTNVNWKLEL